MAQPHFIPGKDAVPILQEAGWAPRPVCRGGKSHPHQDSITDHPAGSSVAILTELPGPRIPLMVYSKAKMKKLMSIQHLLVSNRFSKKFVRRIVNMGQLLALFYVIKIFIYIK